MPTVTMIASVGLRNRACPLKSEPKLDYLLEPAAAFSAARSALRMFLTA
jgi:hypothetical protein